MRSLALPLLVACASPAPEAPPGPTTVRARLAQPTRLLVDAAASTGLITASRNTSSGWQDGSMALAIDDGELDAMVDATGQLQISQLALNLAPIDIPEDVFGKPAQLQDVRVTLAAPPRATTAWTDADDATANATVGLDLDWSIAVDGSSSPLGEQTLSPITAIVSLTGTGDAVDATIVLAGTGQLWSWADLISLSQLQLAVVASTDSQL